MIDLQIRNVNKIYPGGVHAVKDFSMDVEKGEFVVFVGPSGCGKSTMLRMIAGLEEVSSGDLILNDKRINDVASADRDIALVFQNYALFGHMTVYENIGLPMAIRHMKSGYIHKKTMEAARTVELENELNRLPKQLSGGQRQRVAIGRSLVRSPEVFLMDEPLSNLDAKLRTQTRKELAALQTQLKTTTIYVTHDQIEALTLADRIVIMENGVIQQIGTPKEVYMTPFNMFVGSFIGSPPMRFSRGKMEGGKFVSADFNFGPPEEMKVPLFRIRGKGCRSRSAGRAFFSGLSFTYKVECKADIVECLGNEYNVYFTLEENQYIAQFPVGMHRIHEGDSLTLRLNTRALSFFDPETTMRITQENQS